MMRDLADQRFGNYQLLRFLGRGGFADVYLGKHVHLKTKAALKIIRGELDARTIEKFTKEAQLIAALKHPHIVRILEFGFEQQQPFFAMDYAPNGTLRTRHPIGSRLPLPLIVSYVKQVASALTYIHENRLIHRDIKPENMLLDADEQVLLSDFGIVTLAHSTVSMEAHRGGGTAYYMAPEQIQGFPRLASDQYALAVVVYEWITGVHPFSGSSYAEIIFSHISKPLPPLREKVPTLSPQIELVVHKALSKDPQQRFLTVQDFSNALEDACFPATFSSTDGDIPLSWLPEASWSQKLNIELKAEFSQPAHKSHLTFQPSENFFPPAPLTVKSTNMYTETPVQNLTIGYLLERSRKKMPLIILISLGLTVCLLLTSTFLFFMLMSHPYQASNAKSQQDIKNTLNGSYTPNVQNTPILTASSVSTLPPTPTMPSVLIAQPTPTIPPIPTIQSIPTPAHVTMVDNLNDWSQAFSHTPNLSFDSSYSTQYFNNDISRACRTTATHEEIVWYLQGMKSFQAITYFWASEAVSPFSIYTSSDDQHWIEKNPMLTGQLGNWDRYVYTLDNLSNVNYVKIKWNNLQGKYWAPQVSSVSYAN